MSINCGGLTFYLIKLTLMINILNNLLIMEQDGLIQALENRDKEAYLKIYNNNKTGMIFCRNLWSTGEFYSKKIGLRYLKNFLETNKVTQNEYEKVKKEIENSPLPDR